MNPSSLSKQDALNNPTKVRGFIVSQGAAEQPSQLQGGVTAKYQVNETDFTRVTVYGIGRTLINPIPGRIIDLNRNAGGIRASYHSTFNISQIPLKMITGIDYEIQDDHRQEFENNGLPEGEADSIVREDIFNRLQYGQQLLDQFEAVSGYGPFFQFEAGLLSNLNLQGGLRYDWYNFQVNDQRVNGSVDKSGTRTMDQLSPMIGINYLPYPNLSFYGNFSTAFQTPTSSELSNRPNGEGGFNPSLEPERIRSIEAGARGSLFSPRVRYNVTAFSMAIENMIIPYQIADPTSEEVFHENAGAARNRGLEMLVRWHAPARLRWMASYTLMNFTFQEYLVEAGSEGTVQLEGNQIPGVPPQKFYSELGYDHPSGIFGELQLQWVGEYYTNNFNGPAPDTNENVRDFLNDDYATVGLRAGSSLSLTKVNLRIFGGVDNLFDVRYNASIVPNAFGGNFFEPAPGRHWYLGINANFTP
jgi:iron complex outermembrane receptor protein